jgi:hypothetical protein
MQRYSQSQPIKTCAYRKPYLIFQGKLPAECNNVTPPVFMGYQATEDRAGCC